MVLTLHRLPKLEVAATFDTSDREVLTLLNAPRIFTDPASASASSLSTLGSKRNPFGCGKTGSTSPWSWIVSFSGSSLLLCSSERRPSSFKHRPCTTTGNPLTSSCRRSSAPSGIGTSKPRAAIPILEKMMSVFYIYINIYRNK